MITNVLKIKCSGSKVLNQIKDILIEKDNYGRKIFTMKKLLPVFEELGSVDNHRSDYSWCAANSGIALDIISDLIGEEEHQLIFYYHSLAHVNRTWLQLFSDLIKSLLPSKEPGQIIMEHMFYDLDLESGSYYYCDGDEKGHHSNLSILEFATKHHPGLLQYLTAQHDKYDKDKQAFSKSLNSGNEPAKNTCNKNGLLWN